MNFEQISTQDPETVQSKKYESEAGHVIEVTWQKFLPVETEEIKNHEEAKMKANIFLAGWGMESGFASVKSIGSALVKASNDQAYTISTRLEVAGESENPIFEQAQAVKQFILDEGIKELTIFGYSQGGDKAIDLVAMLQNDPELKISGLVLIDSTGLYQQDKTDLAKSFVKDAAVNVPLTLAKQLWQANYSKKQRLSMLKRGVVTGLDIMTGIINDVLHFKTDYRQKLTKEISDMADINLNLDKIQVPVVIIAGDKDPISNPTKIVPLEEEARIVREIENDLENENFVDPREKYLQENLLSNSPYVRMIIGKKIGHHSLPYFRPESVAKVGLYALKRYHRRQNKIQE